MALKLSMTLSVKAAAVEDANFITDGSVKTSIIAAEAKAAVHCLGFVKILRKVFCTIMRYRRIFGGDFPVVSLYPE